MRLSEDLKNEIRNKINNGIDKKTILSTSCLDKQLFKYNPLSKITLFISNIYKL